MKMRLDSAVAKLLSIDASQATLSAKGGGMSSASASMITAKLADGTTQNFFMKTGSGSDAETVGIVPTRHLFHTDLLLLTCISSADV